jgi:aminopeptidase N
VYEYGDACYYEVIYIRGSVLLDELRDAMGNGPFWAAMRAYVDAHRFGFGSTRALLDALDAATPLDFRPRFEALLPSLY